MIMAWVDRTDTNAVGTDHLLAVGALNEGWLIDSRLDNANNLFNEARGDDALMG